MELGATRLKVVSGVCTLVVCGGGAVLVSQDPRPLSAPLSPPVHATTASTLVIPPSCGPVSIGKVPARPAGAADLSKLSPAAQSAVAAIQADGNDLTKTRAILAGLSAADRQTVTAYLRKPGARKGSGGQCSSTPTSPGGSRSSITASQGTGGPVTTLTNSYAS